ncbi:hypothetical protein P8452_66437 [Trifolium repens]|nr:hypothetical protein P8452_66437 [Trifolium repens]
MRVGCIEGENRDGRAFCKSGKGICRFKANLCTTTLPIHFASKSLATLYKNVIATDASEKQLEFATKLPNIRYQHTPSTMSMTELEQMEP